MIIDKDDQYVTTGKTIFEFDNIPENKIDLRLIINRHELYNDLLKLAEYRRELDKYESRELIPTEEIINRLDDIILYNFNGKIDSD